MKVIDARKNGFIRCLMQRNSLTIGIAAISDRLEKDPVVPKIVFCADHLVSSEVASFEHFPSKIKRLSDRCLVITASGDSVASDMILENVIGVLKGKSGEEVAKTKIKDIINLIKIECKKFTDEQIENNILAKYKIVGDKIQVPQQLADKAVEEITAYQYNRPKFQFLVFGFDSIKEPHIYEVDQDSNERLCDSLGFACVGSGSPLAFLNITKASYSFIDDANRAIPLVYFSKRVSEREKGVGKMTDLYVLYGRMDADGKEVYRTMSIHIQDNIMNLLEKAFEEIETFEFDKVEHLATEISKILRGEQNNPVAGSQPPDNNQKPS